MKKFGAVLIFALLVAAGVRAASGRASSLTQTSLFPVAVVAADQLSSYVDIQAYEGPIAFVVNTQSTGSTTKYLDMAIHHATSSAGSYAQATGGAFTQVSSSGGVQIIYLNKDTLRRYVKLNLDVTTSDNINVWVAAQILGFKKYQP